MKRLPLVASFVLFIALCASVAYWAMQLFKPPLRPVAAPPQSVQAEIRPDAAATLFGGSAQKAAVASNYQLKGVIFSGSPRSSVAILSADGKPAQAVRVDMEVAPGVVVKEVHRDYVLLSDNGATKRVELPENAKGQVELANLAPVPVQPSVTPPGASAQTSSTPQAGTAIPSRAQAAAAAGSSGGAAPAVTAPATAVPGQPPMPGSPPTTTTGSPIPSGVVPSVQLPPTAPPTVVVSPPPGTSQSAATTAPPAAGAAAGAARTAPSAAPAAPTNVTSAPTAPAATSGLPPRPSSPDSAPLISR